MALPPTVDSRWPLAVDHGIAPRQIDPTAMTRRHTRIDDDSIAALMAAFYDLARVDPLLGPVLARAIGTNDEAWQAHLVRVTLFWIDVIRAGGRLVGRPMQAHTYLPGLAPAYFRRWLELFAQATGDLFPPHLADEFMERARRMANALQAGMALARGLDRGLDPALDLEPDRRRDQPE